MDFFPFRIFSAFFFQIAANLSYLNYMCAKFQTNLRIFFSWKKVPATHKEFEFFSQKYPRFFNLKLDFFQVKIFSAFFFQIGANLSYLNSMCEKFQTNQRTFFSRKKVPITHKEFDFFFQKFQLEVGIFSDSKHFSHIFQIVAHLSYLNFISVDLKKNQRTFYERSGGREGGHH